jgi:hypothetical protein
VKHPVLGYITYGIWWVFSDSKGWTQRCGALDVTCETPGTRLYYLRDLVSVFRQYRVDTKMGLWCTWRSLSNLWNTRTPEWNFRILTRNRESVNKTDHDEIERINESGECWPKVSIGWSSREVLLGLICAILCEYQACQEACKRQEFKAPNGLY